LLEGPLRVEVSHLSRKNKYAARMGHGAECVAWASEKQVLRLR
jgi:hypothetical protein